MGQWPHPTHTLGLGRVIRWCNGFCRNLSSLPFNDSNRVPKSELSCIEQWVVSRETNEEHTGPVAKIEVELLAGKTRARSMKG